jgi:predicted alpha/beta-hydrolase family hydrolase
MIRCFPLYAVVAFAGVVFAAPPDYAREARWAAEIEPTIVVGDALWLNAPDRARVLAIVTRPAGVAVGGVVLVHGAGVHPDFGVIGALRTVLAERGLVTLSVQMPVLAANAARDDYAALFDLSGDRIEAAVRWLRAQQVDAVAIVGHSIGADVANVWLARASRASLQAFIPLGMFASFAGGARPPTLDVVAQNDFPEVLAKVPARTAQLAGTRCSAAASIPGADHYFGGATAELAARIAPFLAKAFAGDCAKG